MSYHFTKSTNGRRFRLSHTSHHKRVTESYVEIQYASPPQFEDQVFGDLERKMRHEYPKLGFGLRAMKATVDTGLDALSEHARPGGRVGIRDRPQGHPITTPASSHGDTLRLELSGPGIETLRSLVAAQQPASIDDVAQALLDAGVYTDADDDRYFAERVASLLKQKFTITRKEAS